MRFFIYIHQEKCKKVDIFLLYPLCGKIKVFYSNQILLVFEVGEMKTKYILAIMLIFYLLTACNNSSQKDDLSSGIKKQRQ